MKIYTYSQKQYIDIAWDYLTPLGKWKVYFYVNYLFWKMKASELKKKYIPKKTE